MTSTAHHLVIPCPTDPQGTRVLSFSTAAKAWAWAERLDAEGLYYDVVEVAR